MYSLKCKRKDLLDIFSKKGPKQRPALSDGFIDHNNETLEADCLCLIWPDASEIDNLPPSMIITSDKSVEDLLAWSSTYLSEYQPLTTYCYVLEQSEHALVGNLPLRARLNRLECAWVGLILAEAITLSSVSAPNFNIAPLACASTFSFCAARFSALKYSNDFSDSLVERWKKAHKASRQPVRKLELSRILDKVWLLTALSNTKGLRNDIAMTPDGLNNIYVACKQIIENGVITDAGLSYCFGGSANFRTIHAEMLGSRENRVLVFEDAMARICVNKQSFQEASFLCGYLASLVSPGSLDYFDLIWPWLSHYSDAMLWYGICSGLQEKNVILSSFSSIGRRVLRDVLKPIYKFDRPSSDISSHELDVISRSEGGLVFRTGNSGYIDCELFPGVNTFLRKQANDTLPINAPTVCKGNKEYSDAVDKLGKALIEINVLYQKINFAKENEEVTFSNNKSNSKSKRKQSVPRKRKLLDS
ncbi:hypothetical protein DVDV_3807 [Desulfovibrio sp. DV]|uniref:hypothetical protein n=1 Tax=Desulfovibrio sp. DV TaxID=1844708 RepID=UPI000964544E|nr:hypothetical protein [Desulfovibrio sp. DV]OLN24902.1 hypothetical protein DVDV_3807 [Desulfovibrio sp. DV]